MGKLLKFLFNQTIIISLLIILQLGLIAASVFRLSEYFLHVNRALHIISLAVVVHIVNRHANPTYKLAWIIPILIFPLFGGFFYLFIMGQAHTKMFFKRMKMLEGITTKEYTQKDDIVSEIEKTHPERVSTVRYINGATGLFAYRLRSAKYFSTGEQKWKELLSDLEKAEKYIFLEYFIIKKGEMWNSILEILKRKASEGIDVRIIYDGMGCLGSLEPKYNKKLEKYGIKCRIFSPFTPFLSSLQNNRDHRKIAVIDGKIAYTGGINLADEYVNIDYHLGHWKDMGVKIYGEAAFSFAIMFLQMWHTSDRETPDIKSFEPHFPEKMEENGYIMPYHDIPQDNYQTGEFIYLDIINKAKKYIHITTPYLILDHEMVVALINAARGGVDVKIICPAIADHWYARAVAYSYYKELTEGGVRIYEYSPGFIHGKTFASDDEVCVVGSINLDYRSLYLHFECAAWFLDSPVVSMVNQDFEKTLKVCRLITLEECNKIRPWRKLLNAILRIFAPLM